MSFSSSLYWVNEVTQLAHRYQVYHVSTMLTHYHRCGCLVRIVPQGVTLDLHFLPTCCTYTVSTSYLVLDLLAEIAVNQHMEERNRLDLQSTLAYATMNT